MQKVRQCVKSNTPQLYPMNNPPIEPTIKNGGSAFRGVGLIGYRPVPQIKDRHVTRYVSLSEFCARNFITRDTGYKLIRLKLLIGWRQKGRWWVCSNPDCIEQLLEYLGVDELLFDADNS